MNKRSRESSIASSDSEVGSSRTPGSESPHPTKLKTAMVDGPRPDAVMQCSLPPHRDTIDFASIEDFEVHYAKDHSNRCASCGKNFPTAHFLALHIDENHNTFREALEGRGEKTYACFVEDCDKKCSTPQKRRLHLIDKHLFPKIYNFRIVDTGIDRSTSMLHEGRRRRVSTNMDQTCFKVHRRRQSQIGQPQPSAENFPSSEEERSKTREQESLVSKQNVSDPAIKDLEKSMSALRFVPPQINHRNRRNPA